MIVSFDSMALIWATKVASQRALRQTKQNVEEMQKRAQYLLDWIHEEESDVVLPSIVASEFLRGISKNKRDNAMVKLSEFYTIVPFDAAAAVIAADLYDHAKSQPATQEHTRVCMKADLMIVATAKAAKVKRFYSHDAKTREYAAQAGIEARDLPENGPNLFSGK